MYCPECDSEYRPGFTRCEPCGVDLVASPDDGPAEPRAPAPAAGTAEATFVDYCGFVDLDEARRERDRLREHGVLARIAIRETPPGDREGAIEEEFWLRVEHDRFALAARVLGFDAAAAEPGPSFACNACGAEVAEDDDACPSCGARFEDGP